LAHHSFVREQQPQQVAHLSLALRACQRLNTKVNGSCGASTRAFTEELAVVVYDVPTAASPENEVCCHQCIGD